MSDGFRNSIVGGVGALIRAYIKSPNFVPGVSGWSINKDGSAEFNDATFRGTVIIDDAAQALLIYNGAPAIGNLLLAVAPTAGVDAFGNAYGSGLSIEGDASTGFINFMHNDGSIQGNLYVNGPNGVNFLAASGKSLILGSDIDTLLVISDTGIQFDAGPEAKYYSTDRTYSQTGVVSGTFTAITALATVISQHTNYPNAIVAGVFTPPVDSYYDITHHTETPAGTAYCNIRKNGVMQVESAGAAPATATANVTITGLWLTTLDTVDFRIWQNSGVNRTMTGHITIGRRL